MTEDRGALTKTEVKTLRMEHYILPSTRKNAGNMHRTCSYGLCGEIRALDTQ